MAKFGFLGVLINDHYILWDEDAPTGTNRRSIPCQQNAESIVNSVYKHLKLKRLILKCTVEPKSGWRRLL